MKEYKDSFLGQVVVDLVQHCGNGNQQDGFRQLHEWTLVFPTHRAGLFVKEMIRKLMRETGYQQPICAPTVTTHTDLFNSLSDLYAEDEIKMVCRLYHIFKEQTGNDMPLDLFYNWGRQLINDFSNVDKAYPNVEDAEKFWEHSAAASQLETLDIDKELKQRLLELINKDATIADGESKRQQFETLWKSLPIIYTQLNSELAADKKGYEGARLKSALQHKEHALQKIGRKKYAFIGFNYLQPAEKALMQFIQENTETLFYFDYEPDFTTNKVAFERCANNAQEMKSAFENRKLLTNGKVIDVIATSTANAQAQYVHQWLEKYHKPGDSTAIVICDEEMLEPVVFSLPQNERVNITKGFPLRSTKIYATIVSFFNKEAKEKDDEGRDIYDIKSVFTGLLERIKQEEQAERTNDWKGLLVNESVYQAGKIVKRFQALVEDGTLADITTVNGLRNLMIRHLDSVTIPFNGEPLTDLQVIGVLETRTLDFDNLLLLNVEEGIVPQKKSHNSFIPYYISKLYGLQTYNEGAEIYAYNFFRLLRRAKNVTMMFCNGESGGMNAKSMSRFLMQMIADNKRFHIKRFNLTDSAQTETITLKVVAGTATPKLSQLTLCTQEDPKTGLKKGFYYSSAALKSLKSADEDKKTEPFSLSPSAIKTYLTCPRSYYLQKVLNISEEETETLFFERNDIGTLIHNTMQVLYEGISRQKNPEKEVGYPFTITPQDIQSILDRHEAEEKSGSVEETEDIPSIRKALKTAYTKLEQEKGRKLRSKEHETENSVVVESVCNILRADLEQAQVGLEILMQEKKVYSDIKIGNGTIHIGGEIDRLDRITQKQDDGQLSSIVRVVDYKTGRFKEEKMKVESMDKLFEDKNGAQGYLLQTLIYSLACINSQKDLKEDIIKPMLFFTEKQLTTFDSSLKIGDEIIENVRDYKSDIEQRLQAKAQQILTDTNYEQLEDGHCSSYCPFLRLCGKEPKAF